MTPTDPTDRPEPVTLPDAGRGGPPARRGPAMAAIVAGIMAGAVAWAVGETPLVRVKPALDWMVTMGVRHQAPSVATEAAATRATASRSYGALGAALGLALGLAGGLAGRRSVAEAGRAAVVGVALGAVAGGAVTYAAIPLFLRVRGPFEPGLLLSLSLHAAIGGAIGAAAGLAFGLGSRAGLRGLGRFAATGALGALAGVLVFEFAGAVAFPIDQTGEPLAAAAIPRGLANLLLAVGASAGAAVAATRQADGLTRAEGPESGPATGITSSR